MMPRTRQPCISVTVRKTVRTVEPASHSAARIDEPSIYGARCPPPRSPRFMPQGVAESAGRRGIVCRWLRGWSPGGRGKVTRRMKWIPILGELLGDPEFAAGQVRHGLAFDGIDDAVRIEYSADLISSELTVEAWVKPLSPIEDADYDQDLLFGQAFGYPQLLVT